MSWCQGKIQITVKINSVSNSSDCVMNTSVLEPVSHFPHPGAVFLSSCPLGMLLGTREKADKRGLLLVLVEVGSAVPETQMPCPTFVCVC